MILIVALIITTASATDEKAIYEGYMKMFNDAAGELIDFETKQLALVSKLTPLETLVFVSNNYDKSREAQALLYLERARPVLLADKYEDRQATLQSIQEDWQNARTIAREALEKIPILREAKKSMLDALMEALAAANIKQSRIHKYNIVVYDDLAILRTRAVTALDVADKNTSNLADYVDATIAVDLYLARLKQTYWKYANESLESARDNAMFLGLVCILVGACDRFATVQIFWFSVLLCAGSFFCWISTALHWWTNMRTK
jgi:hypothetical protein